MLIIHFLVSWYCKMSKIYAVAVDRKKKKLEHAEEKEQRILAETYQDLKRLRDSLMLQLKQVMPVLVEDVFLVTLPHIFYIEG